MRIVLYQFAAGLFIMVAVSILLIIYPIELLFRITRSMVIQKEFDFKSILLVDFINEVIIKE